MLGLLALADAVAADRWRSGVQLAVVRDLPDADLPFEGARFAAGPGLVVPVRYDLRPGASIRTDLQLSLATGADRVTWVTPVEGRSVRYVSDDHWAMFTAGTLVAGPEVSLRPEGRWDVGAGAAGGAALIGTWHSFDGAATVLLDRDEGDWEDPASIEPYTLQLAPAAGGWLGVRIGARDRLALEIEAGYAVAFVPTAPLRKAPRALNAARTAYALDVLRVGVGVIFP